MKNKYTSLVTFYSLTILLILIGCTVRAQNKILFTDNFTDNHNNWPVKGKKIAITKETGYEIDNIKSEENFIALQTASMDSTKDFEITMKIKNAGKGDYPSQQAGFFFGGRDEKNGYALVVCVDGTIQLLKFTNGSLDHIYMQDHTYKNDVSEKTISIKSEHGRWKIGTIANIRALPLMGNKVGVHVQPGDKWQIHFLEVSEKEKEATSLIDANEEFPFALFITRFQELKCDAESRFSENVDQSKDYMNKELPFNKSIPGLTNPTIIYKETNIELISEKSFYDIDQAYNYYDDLTAAINITPRNDCLRFLSYKDNAEINELFKDFLRHGYWESGATDMKNGKIIDISNAVIQVLSESTIKATGKKYYMVAFHMVVSWNDK